jgi:two-component system, LuxR family, sensor kinase FixL
VRAGDLLTPQFDSNYFLMTAITGNSPEQDASGAGADKLIRRLTARYFFVLVAVATLVVVDQAVIQPLLVRMNSYAPAINLAGRQRMLSQRLTKAALALQLSNDTSQHQRYQTELRLTLTQWADAQAALRGICSSTGTTNLDSLEYNRVWAVLQPHFEEMLAAGKILAGESPEPFSSNNSTSQNNPSGEGPSASIAAVSTIVDHEAIYLSSMEQIVGLFQKDADRQVALLRAIALSIAGAIIGLLLVLGWYVLRPATREIHGQVERLESRVVIRTQQLALSNNSLRREIQERQAAETKNRTMAAQLSHAARVSTIGHIAAALAHEINQPLATIVNYAETCELNLDRTAPLPDSKVRQQIEHIKQTALRAGKIVRRIRNFVRPNQSSSPIEADLNELVVEVVEFCRLEAEQTAAHIKLVLSTEKLLVFIDPIQIQQVLVNLLQNAFHAISSCPPAQRRIEIVTSSSDTHAILSVRDFGLGILLANDSLFVPFSTTKEDGLGIGLSICRTIVEGHHGRIWVETSDASGTLICLSLPTLLDHDASQARIADSICR